MDYLLYLFFFSQHLRLLSLDPLLELFDAVFELANLRSISQQLNSNRSHCLALTSLINVI